MSQTDEKRELMTNMEPQNREQASACGPGCSCNTGSSGRARWVVGAIIIVVAGVLVVRAVLKSDRGPTEKPDAEFAVHQSAGTTTPVGDSTAQTSDVIPKTTALNAPPDVTADKAEDKPVVCGELIQSLGDLNRKALDKDGVFVFLSGRDAAKSREIVAVIEKGAATLRSRNINMGIFTLKDGSSEYANLARQVAPPCVLVMAKGRGASAVSGDVAESKLLQAFVAASSAGGGCGPSSPGCGPSSPGCGPSSPSCK